MDDDDDALCCKEITVSTRRFARENGYVALDTFSLAIERVDGEVIALGISSIERLVAFVAEMNPALVHLAALDDEHAGLITEIRAQVAGDLVADLMKAPTPGEMLH